MFFIKTLGKIKESKESNTLEEKTSEICISQVPRLQQTAGKRQAKHLLE